MEVKEMKVVGRVGKCENEKCKNYGRLGKYKEGFCRMCGKEVKKYVLVERKEEEKVWKVEFYLEGKRVI